MKKIKVEKRRAVISDKMVKESFIEKMILEQRPRRGGGQVMQVF